jgi:hypothetical protein
MGAGGPRVEAARSALSRRPVTGLDQGQEPKSSGDGASGGRVRMTTVDDRMPTKDLEVEVREPAWSHQGSLGSARATGALVRDVRGRCSAHGVHLGFTGGLASGRSALYTTCRHVCDLVAIR